MLFRSAPALEVVLAVAAATAGCAWLAFSLIRVPAVSLRWDGQVWHLGPADAPVDASVPGELAVAIDLGRWMLLWFRPAAPQPRPLLTWLPAQRRGIEPHWHALRCAVHSPRAPAAADPAAGR